MASVYILQSQFSGSFGFSYDALSRRAQIVRPNNVTTSYSYDNFSRLLSVLHQLSGSTIDGAGYTVDSVGNRTSKTDWQAGVTSNYGYDAIYELLQVTQGANTTESYSYDGRLRLSSIADGTLYTLTIPTSGGYAPNSDILQANDSVNGNWIYAYDAFNRLVSASKTGSSYTYDYDRFGNRWHQNGPHTMMLTFSGNNNRMDGYSYDAAGNLLNDGAHSYTYDAENRIQQVDAGTAASYVYDASGRRVRKTTSSGSVDYLYDLAGHEVAEVSSTGGWNRGEVYAGGRHLANYQGGMTGTTYFIHADWLGTERARSTATGASYETCTSLPFGDWLSCSGSDPSPMHFTGKERDSESGLDNFGARYVGSSMGRFMSPDSTAYVKPINPQGWNLYAYALNNPLLYVDPTGHTVSLANCKDQNQCATLLGSAAQLPKGVTATVDKNGNLKLEGELSKIKGGNALRLLQLVQSDKTANFWIGDRSPLPDGGSQPVGGGASGTPSEGFSTSFSVVQADPSKVDSGDLSGVFLGKDGSISTGTIPGANVEETAAHELLGHVWGELIGGQPALVNRQANVGNLREALIAEDRVRNTDPSRGLKIRHQDSGQIIRTSDLPRITNPGSQP
jgi:RHS repeat-associated protein